MRCAQEYSDLNLGRNKWAPTCAPCKTPADCPPGQYALACPRIGVPPDCAACPTPPPNTAFVEGCAYECAVGFYNSSANSSAFGAWACAPCAPLSCGPQQVTSVCNKRGGRGQCITCHGFISGNKYWSQALSMTAEGCMSADCVSATLGATWTRRRCTVYANAEVVPCTRSCGQVSAAFAKAPLFGPSDTFP